MTRLRMGQPVELDLGPADIVKITRRLAAEYQKMPLAREGIELVEA